MALRSVDNQQIALSDAATDENQAIARRKDNAADPKLSDHRASVTIFGVLDDAEDQAFSITLQSEFP